MQRIRKYYKKRKLKEKKLPSWKKKWNHFNESKLGWLEHFVDKMIPWLVIVLLFIILGEFSGDLNYFGWAWMDQVAEFFHQYHTAVVVIDQIVVSFFVVDLYFNFFKKRTFWNFLKSSILDIIAIAPLGYFLRLARLEEAQTILHITTEVEKGAVKAVAGAEATKLTKSARLLRFLARIPRFFRLNRLVEFFKKR